MKINTLQADLGMSATLYKVTLGVSCVWTLHNTPCLSILKCWWSRLKQPHHLLSPLMHNENSSAHHTSNRFY